MGSMTPYIVLLVLHDPPIEQKVLILPPPIRLGELDAHTA